MRAAPIVYPEERPLVRPQAHTPYPEGPDAPTTARIETCRPMGALICFGRRAEGVQGARGKPLHAPAYANFVVRNSRRRGMTRRLRRGWWGCRPAGVVISFEAKESTKERSRHGDSRGGPPRFASRASVCGLSSTSVRFAHPPGKRLLLPILTVGLSMSRAAWLARFHLRSGALGTRLVPPSKWAGLFPSAAYRRPRPRGRRRAYATLAGWDASVRLGLFSRATGHRIFHRRLTDSAKKKTTRIKKGCHPLVRAMRPVAEWRSILANILVIAPDPRAVAPVAPRR